MENEGQQETNKFDIELEILDLDTNEIIHENTSSSQDDIKEDAAAQSIEEEKSEEKSEEKPKKRRKFTLRKALVVLFAIGTVIGLTGFILTVQQDKKAEQQIKEQIAQLNQIKEDAGQGKEEPAYAGNKMLAEYETLYRENSDIIGWLLIEGTDIDYPVMQTPDDEEYYLHRDFYKRDNKNGCLFMDTDSVVGIGTKENNYVVYTKNSDTGEEIFQSELPSANLMIYGHTMNTGAMFGELDNYRKKEYGKAHSIICFDSLYEHRQYELLCAFYSKIYDEGLDQFEYYKFFQADTQEEFDNWYDNIKKLALYDTGVTAEWGDEFITLSCCSYQTKDGRFVVVGKRK